MLDTSTTVQEMLRAGDETLTEHCHRALTYAVAMRHQHMPFDVRCHARASVEQRGVKRDQHGVAVLDGEADKTKEVQSQSRDHFFRLAVPAGACALLAAHMTSTLCMHRPGTWRLYVSQEDEEADVDSCRHVGVCCEIRCRSAHNATARLSRLVPFTCLLGRRAGSLVVQSTFRPCCICTWTSHPAVHRRTLRLHAHRI